VLNDVAKIEDPASRLKMAERARRRLHQIIALARLVIDAVDVTQRARAETILRRRIGKAAGDDADIQQPSVGALGDAVPAGLHLRRDLQVVVADAVHPVPVGPPLGRGLEQAGQGGQSQEVDDREQHQREGLEGAAQRARHLGDQGQGDDGAGQGGHVQLEPGADLGVDHRPGRLQGEVLGGHGQQDRLPVAVAGRAVRGERLQLEPGAE
jgi:hypothetical protein